MRTSDLLRARLTRRQLLKAAGIGAAGVVVLLGASGSDLPPPAQPVQGDLRRFRSRPDLSAPTFMTIVPAVGVASGNLFLTPNSGALIADNTGEPIWIGSAGDLRMVNLQVATYQGAPVLGWWQGEITSGHGQGEYVLLDQHYREVTRIQAGNGYQGDLHELLLTDRGTALITAYGERPGTQRTVFDGIVQEIDIASGAVRFEWHSYPVITEDESVIGEPSDPTAVFDYFHVNAIDVDGDGNLLVSARNTSAVYKIDRSTGELMWRMGGKASDFAVPSDARYQLQHDVRHHPDGTLTIFDDESGEPARAIVLGMSTVPRAIRLLRAYEEPYHQPVAAQGSAQLLPDGGLLVGWGNEPAVTEFSEDGSIRFHARFDAGESSYRVRRHAWTGHPADPPDVAVDAIPGWTTVHVSWNGATEVTGWQVLSGPSASRLSPVAAGPRTGFETSFTVRPTDPWIVARALDASGTVLAESTPLHL
jgi:Arylsulfotransferase (ASST)